MGLSSFAADREPLLFDLEPVRDVLHFHPRNLQQQIRHQPLFREHFVGVELYLRLTVFGIDAGNCRLLRHRVALEAHAQTIQIRLGRFQLKLGVHGLLFHLRVRKFYDHRAGSDLDPGLDQNLFDAPVRGCGHPPSHLRNQSPVTVNIAYHLAALDRVDHRGGTIECGRGRF